MDNTQNEPNANLDGVQFSDPAPDSEATENQTDNLENGQPSQEEQVIFDDKQQAKVNDIIGSKVAQTHKERQRAETAEARVKELEASQPKQEAPEIPPMPDPDDFYGDPNGLKAAQDQRDEVIRKRAEFDHQQTMLQNQQQVTAQQQEQETIREQQEVVKNYVETAKSFNISPEQMQKDANLVAFSGITPEIADHLAIDPQGPLITNFLASNVMELETLKTMNPMQAAVHIATQIKPKLAGAVNTTNAPPPADIVDGSGAPEKEHPALEGVTFE